MVDLGKLRKLIAAGAAAGLPDVQHGDAVGGEERGKIHGVAVEIHGVKVHLDSGILGAGVLGLVIVRGVHDVLGVREEVVIGRNLFLGEGLGDVVAADHHVEGIIADGAEAVQVVRGEERGEARVVQGRLVTVLAQGQEGQVRDIGVGIEGFAAALVDDRGDVDAGVIARLLSVQGVQAAGQALDKKHLAREVQGDAALRIGHIGDVVGAEEFVVVVDVFLFGEGGGGQGREHQDGKQDGKQFLHFFSFSAYLSAVFFFQGTEHVADDLLGVLVRQGLVLVAHGQREGH